MERKHSWNWLPARFTGFGTVPDRALRRPPVSLLEQLEDRVLLSAVPGADKILIGLIKGQVDLRTEEVNFLQQAANTLVGDKVSPASFLTVQDDLYKVNDAVGKLIGFKLLGGEGDNGQKELTAKLDDAITAAFADIEAKLTGLGENSDGRLLPAVQNIQDNTAKFVDAIKLLPGGILDNKLAASFNKIEEELGQIDKLTGKVSFEDIKIVKNTDKSSPVLMQKISDEFIKIETDIAGFGNLDEGIKGEIDTLKVDTLNFLTSLAPPTITTDGGFTGGVTTSDTGDVIG